MHINSKFREWILVWKVFSIYIKWVCLTLPWKMLFCFNVDSVNDQTFDERCPDSDWRYFRRQLAGSTSVRLVGNFNHWFVERMLCSALFGCMLRCSGMWLQCQTRDCSRYYVMQIVVVRSDDVWSFLAVAWNKMVKTLNTAVNWVPLLLTILQVQGSNLCVDTEYSERGWNMWQARLSLMGAPTKEDSCLWQLSETHAVCVWLLEVPVIKSCNQQV